MMNFDELVKYLGSIEYEARLGVFSGWSTFRNHLEVSEVAKALIAEATASAETKREIEKQLWSLVEDTSNPNVIHTHDAGITTYLYALNAIDQPLSEVIARKLEARNDLWWGRYLLRDILHVPVANP